MSSLDRLVGTSAAMATVREEVRRLLEGPGLTAGPLPAVLILGEPGTGKGFLVRLMHEVSARAGLPLIEVNCAAMPADLIEAELFGFERGIFRNAGAGGAGLVQAAHRGVLFLDEIGSLPLSAQATLLAALEQREVRWPASTSPEPADVWILSAADEDLSTLVARGQFRLDLNDRIAAVTLRLPPLRERGRDVLALARHFLDRLSADYGLPPKRLTPDAEQMLLAHAWPGNVRELANLLERSVLLADGDDIGPEALPLPRPGDLSGEAAIQDWRSSSEGERESLARALEDARWNLSRAAVRLGMPRATLRSRIERLGLRPARPARRDPAPPGPMAASGSTSRRLRWERRWITALQVSLAAPPSGSGFHLTPLLDELVKKVQGFGGQPDELHPLGFTALFGHDPVEDAPVRAALAARSLAKAVERTRDPDGTPVTSRIAIHVAEILIARGVAVGGMDLEDRRRLRQVLGSLLDAAPADAVAVSDDASRFLERRFTLERLAEQPQLGFRLTGGGRSGFEVGGRIESPLVGRDTELGRLDELLAEAERGRGQVVGIVGEPGVGKSRLLHELRRGVGPERVRYLEGRCAPHAAHSPYLPIIQILREAFDFTEDEDVPTIERKVRDGTASLGLLPETVVPYLLHLLGMRERVAEDLARLTPEAARHRTIEALRQVMVAAGQKRPIVLAIEDLQWVDPTSADSLTSLLDSVAAGRILLLTTYRQGYRPPWLGRPHVTQLVLRRLSPRESLTIVEAIAASRALSPGVADTLVTKADGIPFFLEELVRAVTDRAAREGALTDIPETIQGVITARLDRLPAADRDLLQAAAVLGKEGGVPLLAELSGLTDPAFASALARLRTTDFLRESRLVPYREYAFTHVLSQEVAYRNLPAERRRALHGAAASAIERLSPQTSQRMPELVAHHLTEAGQADAAIALWHRAGQLAIDRSANVEAISHLRKALALLEALPAGSDRARRELGLELTLGTALAAHGGYGARVLEQTLGRIRVLTDELGDAPEITPARFGLWRFSISRANFATAEKLADQLLAAGRPDEAPTMIPGLVATGITAFYRGRFLDAREHFQRAAAMQQPEFSRAQIARYGNDLGVAALSFLGWTLTLMGEVDRGAEIAEQAMRRARDIGHPLTLAVALNWAGLVHCERYEVAPVEQHARELLALSREQGFAFFTALGTIFLGWARVVRGAPGDGLALLREGYDRYLGAHQRVGLRLRVQLAEALVAAGAIDEALARLDEFFAHARDSGEGALLSELYRVRGEALGRRSPADPEAERCLAEAVAIARGQHAATLGLRAAIPLVRLQRGRGGPAPAVRALREMYAGVTQGLELHHAAAARALLQG